MLIDLTLPVDADGLANDETFKHLIEAGHAGTHFDVVDKVFSLSKFRSNGKIVDIRDVRDREIEIEDLGGLEVDEGDFIIFYTGYIDEYGWNTKGYVKESANLSDTLVEYLVGKNVNLIGCDAAGIQTAKKHAAVDRYCADRDVFVVENLSNLKVLSENSDKEFTVFTAPLARTDLSGLPCRVIVEISDSSNDTM